MIHLCINDQADGPHSEADIQRMLDAGKITRETLGWKEGMEQWQPLSDFFGKDIPPSVGNSAAPGASSGKSTTIPPATRMGGSASFGTATGSFVFSPVVAKAPFAIVFLVGVIGSIVAGVFLKTIPSVGEDGALMIAIGGISLSILGPIVAYYIARSAKISVSMFQHGFELVRRKQTTRLHLSEIRDLRLTETLGVRNGSGANRTLLFATERQKFGLESRTSMSEVDPLLDLYQRMVTGCAATFPALAAKGQSLRGQGWVFTKDGLSVQGRNEVIALVEIDFVGEFDGKVGFYKKGEEEPGVAFPSTGSNVHILMEIVRNDLKANNRTRVGSKISENLGRVLFTKNILGTTGSLTRAFVWGFMLFVAWAIGMGLSAWLNDLLFHSKGAPNAFIRWTILILCQGVSFTFIVLWIQRSLRCMLRCHEHGVFRRTLFSERKIRFDEMTAFTNQVTKSFVNGIYAGTSMHMEFECEPKKIKIGYIGNAQGTDTALDKLSDVASLHVARHLISEIAEGKPVLWGDAQMGVDGLSFPSKKKKTEPVMVPYEKIKFTIQAGDLYLFWKGTEDPDMTIACGSKNFWPCLLILQGDLD